MRYYELTLKNQDGKIYKIDPNGEGFILGTTGSTFSSQVTSNGSVVNNPGALNIEFEIKATPNNTPQGGSIIRIWGIGLQCIGQAANLNGATFQLNAGMMKGLPLADPSQAGPIAQGRVFQGFGNWQGINQTIDLICNPGELVTANGISFDWAKGVPLSAALRTTFAQAFPSYPKPIIKISDLMAPKGMQAGSWYPSIGAFSQVIADITEPLGAQLNPPTRPVQIVLIGNQFYISDGSTSPPVKQLVFSDLIGQPTWINSNAVTFKTVLRSDIGCESMIQFPKGVMAPYALIAGTAAPNSPARSKSIFQSTFVVSEVHHYANFRQPDAESWNTTFTAIATSIAGTGYVDIPGFYDQ